MFHVIPQNLMCLMCPKSRKYLSQRCHDYLPIPRFPKYHANPHFPMCLMSLLSRWFPRSREIPPNHLYRLFQSLPSFLKCQMYLFLQKFQMFLSFREIRPCPMYHYCHLFQYFPMSQKFPRCLNYLHYHLFQMFLKYPTYQLLRLSQSFHLFHCSQHRL